ncbi:MAG: septal ring lytic transglycosylase RlpA family protein [Desulfobacteraceae bacterium]
MVVASWYGPKFHGLTMANGQRFDMYRLTVAHRTLPLGTKLVLINPRNGKKVKARVSDRGPYIHGRQLDVSYEVARQLHFVRRGVTRLEMQVIG